MYVHYLLTLFLVSSDSWGKYLAPKMLKSGGAAKTHVLLLILYEHGCGDAGLQKKKRVKFWRNAA